MFAIGLTGGIGSGKSTVARFFVDLGAVLIDTDAIAREITAPGGSAIGALRAEFGPAAIAADGGLDRPRMRELAFSDPGVRQRLEGILHPAIGAAATAQAAANPGRVVFDVPLLAESAVWRSRCDFIAVVDCLESTQIWRVATRPGWTASAAKAVISQQASRARRRAIADAVIWNDAVTLEQLAEQATMLWRFWTGVGMRVDTDSIAGL